MDNRLLLLVLVFITVVVVVMLVGRIIGGATVRGRLRDLSKTSGTPEGQASASMEPDTARKAMLAAARTIAQVAEPAGGWDKAPVRQRLAHAGIQRESGPMVFFASKIVLSVVLGLAAFVVLQFGSSSTPFSRILLMVIVAALVGYLLPDLVVSKLGERRKNEIRRGLPDAADFLVVCVEAGTGLDAAFTRVAHEIERRSPSLAQEMQWVTLEVRAGRARESALRNLAERTGVEEILTLANMLTQADRFGTSTADALRVYADMLRSSRRQQAEEVAAKIPVKLLIPMIFCIFPALLVVLAGPAFMSIARTLLPGIGGR